MFFQGDFVLKLLILTYLTFASFYGSHFGNRRTASGERLSNKSLMAAHRYLPFGTRVKVTNPVTKQEVIVTIVDRGPFVRGRDLDLTQAAFKKLAPLSQGVVRVEYSVLD